MIAAIILTYNEEKHIERCIKSLKHVCREIFVIDSGSTDNTLELAKHAGATSVLFHEWTNYSTQFNWGLEHAPITTEWVWRIDADEFITEKLAELVQNTLTELREDSNVNGIFVNRRIDFMGRPLMHGGWYPQRLIKIFRKGFASCENRWMDEHIRLSSGETISIEEKGADQVDANLNDLTWWTGKHNSYATREMVDMLLIEYGLDDEANEIKPRLCGTAPERKRWLKLKYVSSPLFIRPFLNFFLRYILKAGFLDGYQGFVWHILQGFWYRFLVDAKIWEVKRKFNGDRDLIIKWVKDKYCIYNS